MKIRNQLTATMEMAMESGKYDLLKTLDTDTDNKHDSEYTYFFSPDRELTQLEKETVHSYFTDVIDAMKRWAEIEAIYGPQDTESFNRTLHAFVGEDGIELLEYCGLDDEED